MRRPNLAAEGWAPQHNFPFPHSHEVGEIGVAAGILFDRNGSVVAEALAQERLQPDEVEFFSRSHHSRLVAKCHVFVRCAASPLSLALPLAGFGPYAAKTCALSNSANVLPASARRC